MPPLRRCGFKNTRTRASALLSDNARIGGIKIPKFGLVLRSEAGMLAGLL
jgi:hypothetical protein